MRKPVPRTAAVSVVGIAFIWLTANAAWIAVAVAFLRATRPSVLEAVHKAG